MKRFSITALSLFLILISSAGSYEGSTFCRVKCFTVDDGMPHDRVTSIVQDKKGFIWMGSWGGLIRYDGYTFYTFRPTLSDISGRLASSRFFTIAVDKYDNIWCLSKDDNIFFFDRRTCLFTDVLGDITIDGSVHLHCFLKGESGNVEVLLDDGRSIEFTSDSSHPSFVLHSAAENSGRVMTSISTEPDVGSSYTTTYDGRAMVVAGGHITIGGAPVTIIGDSLPLEAFNYAFSDNMGRLWLLPGHKPVVVVPYHSFFSFTDVGGDEVRSLLVDSRGRLLYGIKTSEGWGRLMMAPHRPLLRSTCGIYCISEDNAHRLWVGTRGDGIYLLTPADSAATHYTTRHFIHDSSDRYSLSNNNIYQMTEDRRGNMWIVTYGGGVNIAREDAKSHFTFLNYGNSNIYPAKDFLNARCIIEASDGTMLIGTTNGLVSMLDDGEKIRYNINESNKDDEWRLKGKDIMQICLADGRIFLCIYGIGVAEIVSDDLLSDSIRFKTYYMALDNLSDQMLAAVATSKKELWMVSLSQMVRFSLIDNTFHPFSEDMLDYAVSFTEALPAVYGHKICFGTTKGIFSISDEDKPESENMGSILITSVQYQGENVSRPINDADTLIFPPERRNFVLSVSLSGNIGRKNIVYRYRLIDYDHSPNYLTGGNHTLGYKNLPPGTYTLMIDVINAAGEWQAKERYITVIISERFTETKLFRLIMLVVIAGLIISLWRLWRYILRLQQSAMALDKMRGELIELRGKISATGTEENQTGKESSKGEGKNSPKEMSAADSEFIDKTRAFVKKNLDNGELSVSDLAHDALMSYTSFYTKMKQTTGLTPVEFIKRERINYAKNMLGTSDRNISEVAYAVGFNDPKYFSKVFRHYTGKTPKEYLYEKSKNKYFPSNEN